LSSCTHKACRALANTHPLQRRRYQVLQHYDSPQLPAGHATTFVLALVPPLWRRIMDPRAVRAREARRCI
jgi:hypothetical protein